MGANPAQKRAKIFLKFVIRFPKRTTWDKKMEKRGHIAGETGGGEFDIHPRVDPGGENPKIKEEEEEEEEKGPRVDLRIHLRKKKEEEGGGG